VSVLFVSLFLDDINFDEEDDDKGDQEKQLVRILRHLRLFTGAHILDNV